MLNIDLQNMWRHLRFPKKAAKPKKNTYSAKQIFFVCFWPALQCRSYNVGRQRCSQSLCKSQEFGLVGQTEFQGHSSVYLMDWTTNLSWNCCMLRRELGCMLELRLSGAQFMMFAYFKKEKKFYKAFFMCFSCRGNAPGKQVCHSACSMYAEIGQPPLCTCWTLDHASLKMALHSVSMGWKKVSTWASHHLPI